MNSVTLQWLDLVFGTLTFSQERQELSRQACVVNDMCPPNTCWHLYFYAPRAVRSWPYKPVPSPLMPLMPLVNQTLHQWFEPMGIRMLEFVNKYHRSQPGSFRVNDTRTLLSPSITSS